MQLYLVRHAQSVNNAIWENNSYKHMRVEDPEITELGKKQAAVTGRFIKKNFPDVDRIYCSLMLRAVQTGTIISNELGCPLYGDMDLFEKGGIVAGDGRETPFEGRPGKNRKFFESEFPMLQLPGELNHDGWWNSKPLETTEACNNRSVRVLEMLKNTYQNSDEIVVVITHGAFYNYILRNLMGYSGENQIWFGFYNTGITKIDYGIRKNYPESWIIDYCNYHSHLPEEIITM